ncbi:MAG: phosphoribosylanthranilate isomerase [Oscillospiraceae bacterium]|nr:phosphoribosylanthranilate isomerase [Oscillospiraceae bacterium]MBQ8978400.1 phosphoribosylanthranilate isomerase [Oscillospiraceae bacterium]
MKIKMCGMCREQDIMYANAVRPDYVGYIFAPSSRRYITPEQAAAFTDRLDKSITPVGVFINEDIGLIARLAGDGIIGAVQLHGTEDAEYISHLRRLTALPIIKAYKIRSESDTAAAQKSSADMILLDSGEGSGRLFDHSLLKGISRPYFLAGGLDTENIGAVLRELSPFGVDVSSGIETDGSKDMDKMQLFADIVRRTR